jgi:hypothetical protein
MSPLSQISEEMHGLGKSCSDANLDAAMVADRHDHHTLSKIILDVIRV